jgi:GT2 family glycosyltransferase
MGQILSEIDVSVVIVNYNCFHLLDECLKSLFEKTSEVKLQVIVVDNASTDGNVNEITNKYKSVETIVNDKNLGFAAANNLGLQRALGKYTLFLNNDIVFIENSIKSAYEYAEISNEKIFVGIQLLNSDLSKQESVVEFPSIWNTITENFFLYKFFPGSKWFNKYYQNNLIRKEPFEVDVIRGAFMFCPTLELKNMSGFDDRFYFYSEETDLCYRFKKTGGKIYFLPNVNIIHIGGATTDKNLWFKFKNQTTGKIQYYQKHFLGMNFFLVLIIHWTGLFVRSLTYFLGGLLTLNKSLLLKGYYFLKQIFVYPLNKFI